MAITQGYSDTLRALGRFLDDVTACEIGIIEREDEVFVSWSGRAAQRFERRVQIGELEALRTTARMYRGLGGASPRFTVGELLRALGSVLDEICPSGMAITEAADGFRLSAQVGGERVMRSFTYSELVARGQTQHRQRSA
jgi:hypothetical protein